ncbi:glycine cleavage system aminomethyltransferase GcvT, partial [Candidatus Sumerlaeota bacterium]|nr:glycine cleavage system aminomethyltransferase GcvT [Candidatus Sumerlaeota bacterium]
MKETPLAHWHRQHGARVIDFHGWLMPLQYTSITEEHLAVRKAVGLFDLCHMARIRLSGPAHAEFASYVTTGDVVRMGAGKVDYAFLCNEQGGIVDDITIYRQHDSILLVVNSANRLKVLDWLGSHRDRWDVEISDVSDALAMIAIQGPRAERVLQKDTDFPLASISYYHFATAAISGQQAIVSRTGYTGEDGFEVYLDATHISNVWERLLEQGKEDGLVPVGLGARDTLRLEAALPLYGNEINETTTPFEAGLGKFVALDKADFVGREALVARSKNVSRRLCCLVMDERAVPRSGYSVFAGQTDVGRVTSGTFSPSLERGIALAYVDVAHSAEGASLA